MKESSQRFRRAAHPRITRIFIINDHADDRFIESHCPNPDTAQARGKAFRNPSMAFDISISPDYDNKVGGRTHIPSRLINRRVLLFNE